MHIHKNRIYTYSVFPDVDQVLSRPWRSIWAVVRQLDVDRCCPSQERFSPSVSFRVFFLVWTLTRRRQGRDLPAAGYQTYVEVFLLLLTAYLFLGPNLTPAYSATSTIALSVGLTAFVAFVRMQKNLRYRSAVPLMVIIMLIISYGTITPFIGKLSIVDVSSAFGRNETLTERSTIWSILVPLAEENIILGHGFGGFWNEEIRDETSSHAHNGYLDVILNLGVPGLILFSMFILASCRKAQKTIAYDFDWSVFWKCFLLMAVVLNIAESVIVYFDSHFVSFLLFLSLCSQTTNAHSHPISTQA